MKFDRTHSGDVIVLGAHGTIKRDADGVPVAFLIFRPGKVDLTMQGQSVEGTITQEHIKEILDYHALKSELIPVDCEHFLQRFADEEGVEESELLKKKPLLGEQAAAGFVSLVSEGGELWAKVVKWTDRARALLSGEAGQMYGYFSPVLRGLQTPPLRITSLALTNVPALNRQELLAATAEKGIAAADVVRMTEKQKPPVTVATIGSGDMEIIKSLAMLCSLDVGTFTAEGADRSPLFKAAVDLIEKLQGDQASFIGEIKEALELKDDAALSDVSGKILSLVEKGKTDSTSLTDMTARLEVLEKEEHTRLVEKLKAEGKLTVAMVDWAQKRSAKELNDWAENAPVVVESIKRTPPQNLDKTDQVTMSDFEIKVARMCGNDPAKVAERHGMKMPATA